MGGRIVLAVTCAVAFGALAAMVAHGSPVHGLDTYAVRQLMPGLDPASRAPSAARSLIPLRHVAVGGRDTIRLVTNIWTLPASAGVSALLFALGFVLLRRRGEATAALVWAAVWVAGNVIEVRFKSVIERPALFALDHGARVHVAGFDHSYPSGHTIRSLLFAGLLTALWPRYGRYAFAWTAVALPLLLAAGFHTPSDIAGGALLAGLLLVLARERQVRATRPRSSCL